MIEKQQIERYKEKKKQEDNMNKEEHCKARDKKGK